MSQSPWRSMWVKPRETIRSIIMENPKKSLWYLAFICGLNQTLGQFEMFPLAGKIGLLPMLLVALILAPLVGWVLFTVWSWLILLTGRLLKGHGNFLTIRAASAWATVPIMGSLILWIPLILSFSDILFFTTNTIILLPHARAVYFSAIVFGKVAFFIWSVVLFVSALAEVQQFSILRAIANILLAIISFLVIWIAINVLIGSLIYMKGA